MTESSLSRYCDIWVWTELNWIIIQRSDTPSHKHQHTFSSSHTNTPTQHIFLLYNKAMNYHALSTVCHVFDFWQSGFFSILLSFLVSSKRTRCMKGLKYLASLHQKSHRRTTLWRNAPNHPLFLRLSLLHFFSIFPCGSCFLSCPQTAPLTIINDNCNLMDNITIPLFVTQFTFDTRRPRSYCHHRRRFYLLDPLIIGYRTMIRWQTYVCGCWSSLQRQLLMTRHGSPLIGE